MSTTSIDKHWTPKVQAPNQGEVRRFATGATRDTDNGKLDYEAFLSPLALRRYAEYMHAHRKQSDGTMRDGDNWQRGIPIAQYMKSRFRHFFDTWELHRAGGDMDVQQEVNLCAEIFNAMGQLHEILKAKQVKADRFKTIVDDAAKDIAGCMKPEPYQTTTTPGIVLPTPKAGQDFIRYFGGYTAPKSGYYRVGKTFRLRKGDLYLYQDGSGIGTATAGDEENAECRRLATYMGPKIVPTADDLREGKDTVYGEDNHPCR